MAHGRRHGARGKDVGRREEMWGAGKICGAQGRLQHALQYALGSGAITCAMGCCKRNNECKRVGEDFIIKGKIDGSAI